MFSFIFLLLIMTSDINAMEEISPRFFSTSGSSNSVFDSVFDGDNTKPLTTIEETNLGISKKRVHFSQSRPVSSYDLSSSRSSSKESQELLKKHSKSKKNTYQEKQKKELLALMKSNNTQDILNALHPDINITDEDGRTPLILATRNNNNSVVTDLLLHKFIDLNMKDKWGNTALHYATLQHNSNIIKLLLDDCRTDSSITNDENRRAFEFFEKESHKDSKFLKDLFFIKLQLDLVIGEIIPTLPKKFDKNTLGDVIIKIKKRIENECVKQAGYQPLPEENQKLPDDPFIKKVVICRWIKQGICTSQVTEIRTNITTTSAEGGMVYDNADNFIAYMQVTDL